MYRKGFKCSFVFIIVKIKKVLDKAELVLYFGPEQNENIVRCGQGTIYVSTNSIVASRKLGTDLELEYSRINDVEVEENFGDNSKLEIYFEGSIFRIIAGKEDIDHLYTIKHFLKPIIKGKEEKD